MHKYNAYVAALQKGIEDVHLSTEQQAPSNMLKLVASASWTFPKPRDEHHKPRAYKLMLWAQT